MWKPSCIDKIKQIAAKLQSALLLCGEAGTGNPFMLFEEGPEIKIGREGEGLTIQ
jgi:hypothetical protein